ncbi:hypothetical protein ACROYT_G003024 [Oculina patagonica]
MSRSLVDKVIRLCESRGFSVESRIGGALGTTYTYHFGPLGTELRRNLRNAWWNDVVRSKGNIYGFETTNELITQAAGQTPTTNSERAAPLIENTNTLTQLFRVIPGIAVPFGAAWNRKYYTKPENDNYILRSCEKEVMTLEFFCAENRVTDWTNHWKRQRLVWWRKFANVRSNFSVYDKQADLEPGLHNQTFIQYSFPWGKESIDSMTVRSDLHKRLTNEECNVLPFNKESLPYVIQIKTDFNTGFMALLMDAYQEKERSDSSGNVNLCTVLYLHPQLAPIKVAVLSQIPQQNELCELALQLSSELREAGISTQCSLHANADECYAYQDEVGTPYCITILDTTLTNGVVAFRSRNTTLQEYMHMSDILSTVNSHLGLNAQVQHLNVM